MTKKAKKTTAPISSNELWIASEEGKLEAMRDERTRAETTKLALGDIVHRLNLQIASLDRQERLYQEARCDFARRYGDKALAAFDSLQKERDEDR